MFSATLSSSTSLVADPATPDPQRHTIDSHTFADREQLIDELHSKQLDANPIDTVLNQSQIELAATLLGTDPATLREIPFEELAQRLRHYAERTSLQRNFPSGAAELLEVILVEADSRDTPELRSTAEALRVQLAVVRMIGGERLDAKLLLEQISPEYLEPESQGAKQHEMLQKLLRNVPSSQELEGLRELGEGFSLSPEIEQEFTRALQRGFTPEEVERARIELKAYLSRVHIEIARQNPQSPEDYLRIMHEVLHNDFGMGYQVGSDLVAGILNHRLDCDRACLFFMEAGKTLGLPVQIGYLPASPLSHALIVWNDPGKEPIFWDPLRKSEQARYDSLDAAIQFVADIQPGGNAPVGWHPISPQEILVNMEIERRVQGLLESLNNMSKAAEAGQPIDRRQYRETLGSIREVAREFLLVTPDNPVLLALIGDERGLERSLKNRGATPEVFEFYRRSSGGR